MKKKLLASLLALVLLLGMLPLTALADGSITAVTSIDDVILAPLGTNTAESGSFYEGYATAYTLTAPATGSDAIMVTATDLVKHERNSGTSSQAYWVGFGIKQPSDATVTYFRGAGDAADVTETSANNTTGGHGQWFSAASLSFTKDGTTYASFYFNVESIRGVNYADGKCFIIQKVEKNDTATYSRYVFDLSGVTFKQYTISGTGETDEGTVAVSATDNMALVGDEVTITATPNAGYKLSSLTVKDTENNPVTVTDNKFTMPASDVTVTATFVDENALTFSTIPSDVATAILEQSISGLGTFEITQDGTDVTVTGTAKYIASFAKFNPGTSTADIAERKGHYLPIQIQGAQDQQIRIVNRSEGGKNGSSDPMTFGSDGSFEMVIWLDAGNDYTGTEAADLDENTFTVTLGTGESAKTYIVDFSGVTLVPASDDATISDAKIADVTATIAVKTAENDGSTAEKAIEITTEVPAGTTMTSVSVVLTVDPTATVTTGTAVGTIDTAATNTDGTVSIDGADLTPAATDGDGNVTEAAKVLYVKVVAEDGETTMYYKVTATVSAIAVADPVATVIDPKEGAIPTEVDPLTADITAATTATKLDTDTANADKIAAAAFEEAKKVEINEEEAKTELDAETVYIVVVPEMQVQVTNYTPAKAATETEPAAPASYTVNITPIAKVYVTSVDPNGHDFSSEDLTDENSIQVGGDIELTEVDPVDVVIGIPSDLATDGDKVYVDHKSDHFLETVAGNKVTVTVSSFSPFVVTKAAKAIPTNITLSDGTLSPAFVAGTVVYSANVANNVTSITVTPILPAGLTATVNGEASSTPVELAVGANTITVVVNFSDGTDDTATSYTITVTRAAASSGGGGGGGTSSNVSSSSNKDGKVDIDNPTAKEGDNVKFTVKPNSGKVVDTVTVTDDKGNKVAVTDLGNGKYSFVMPKGKVTIKVTYADASSTGFTDVAAGAYYADAVAWALEKGITNGTSATTFSPESPCTRAQIVTFLWRAAGSPKATGSNPFADVSTGAYYYDAVLWAVEKGITNGTGANTFSPDDTCTRGQTVTFLYRYAGEPAAAGSNPFADVAAGQYYTDAVLWAVSKGITNGTGADTFSPANTCTRGQIVTFLYRDLAE